MDNDFKEEVAEMKKMLCELSHSLSLMEHNIIEQLSALFEVSLLHSYPHDEFYDEINTLEKRTDNHSVKISVLETISETHST